MTAPASRPTPSPPSSGVRTRTSLLRAAEALGVDVHFDPACPVAWAVDEVGVVLRPPRTPRARRIILTHCILRCLALRRG